MAQKFEAVTLLVTHYNRSRSLERLLQTFAEMGVVFGDIVVSDDGSQAEHLKYLQTIKDKYSFRLITTPQNKGLGNNINKGQDAVKTPLTMYIQEDFEPIEGCENHLADAIALMTERQDIDLMRFYAYFKYPYLKPYRNGFSEMKFWVWYPGYRKFHVYSDHPHLRRTTFFEKFGRYREGLKGDRTEFLMALSFLKHQGKAMFYEDYKDLFHQKNTSDEPSTMKRNDLRQSNNIFIVFARAIYRNVKHTYEFLTFPA